MEKIYRVNKVEGFNPYDYLVPMRDEITGEVITSELTGKPKMYLPAAAKKAWFRMVYPHGTIIVLDVPRDDGQYEFAARIFKDAEAVQPLGTGYALRTKAVNEKYRPFESAQTLAVSAALENAGFGSEVSLYLQMQEAVEESEAPAPKPLPSDVLTDVPEVPNPVSFEVKEAEEPGSDDEEAMKIFESLGVKAEKPKKKASKKKKADVEPEKEEAKPVSEEPATPAEEPAPAEAATSEEEPEPVIAEPPAEEPEAPAEPEEADVPEDASAYVVLASDVKGVHALDMFIGQTLADLGKENIKFVLELAGEKISDSFRKAAEVFVTAA